jgi:hypothetical protein
MSEASIAYFIRVSSSKSKRGSNISCLLLALIVRLKSALKKSSVWILSIIGIDVARVDS